MDILKDLGKNAAAVLAMEVVGVSDMIIKPSDSRLVRNLKLGGVWTGVDIGLDYVDTKQVQMQWQWYLDSITYNSAIVSALDYSGLASKITSAVQLPFDSQVNEAIISGGLKLGAKMVRDIIDSQWQGSQVYYISHVSNWIS